MTKFSNDEEIIEIIQNDLKYGLKTDSVMVFLSDYSKDFRYIKTPKKFIIDDIDITANEYKLNAGLLKANKTGRKKTVRHYSNILKTNCPITGQPDWATVFIEYKSRIIVEPSSLLKYLISYRNHNDYHESCCEKIFMDLFNILIPEKLTVKCFYTRRGGIDINPARFYGVKPDKKYEFRYWRQ
jgi:7-cyano-7-deazaguanine reductase